MSTHDGTFPSGTHVELIREGSKSRRDNWPEGFWVEDGTRGVIVETHSFGNLDRPDEDDGWYVVELAPGVLIACGFMESALTWKVVA